MNIVKDKLKAGETVIGTTAFAQGDNRFLAGAGFDFLLFDTQHSPDEIKALQQPIQMMRGTDAIPVIRVGENRADQICYALDQGAKGVIVPMVNNRAEAEMMVRFCKYPFEGVRSSAGMRGDWGKFDSYRQYMDAVNKQQLIIPMIETQEAMDNLAEIAKVPGVDVLLVGPSDLSISLDVPLDYQSPTYHKALDQIAAVCTQAGVVAGMYFVPPGIKPEVLMAKGFRFFTMPWERWAGDGIRSGLAGLRSTAGSAG